MTLKDKFSDGDWTGVLEAPMLAGFAITAADPGGLIGAVQESAAVAGALKEAATGDGGSALAKEVAEAYRTPEGRKAAMEGVKTLAKGKRPAEASEAAVARLGEIVQSVERSAPDQAAAFRAFLMDAAQKTAEAAKEGGFLGFGGEQISDAEHKTLADLGTVLGTAAV